MSKKHRVTGYGTKGDATGAIATNTPGKRTLTQGLPTSPAGGATSRSSVVQRNTGMSAQARDATKVHASAEQGITTPVSPLPHAESIQRLFGRHDVSSVQAHLGADAAASARDMGAKAYAFGNHIVLGEQTDLFTAAHEAAHVIQQRGGVHLKDDVGRAGDRYEQHADSVAQIVVQGQSAERLLDQYAGSGGGEAAVQRDDLDGGVPGGTDSSGGDELDGGVPGGTNSSGGDELDGGVPGGTDSSGGSEERQWSEAEQRCIDAMGGSPTYRPGGIATPDELDEYRRACVASNTIKIAAVEITFVNDNDLTGWLSGATRIGEVKLTDVNSMVNNALQIAGPASISLLYIDDHGNPEGIYIGSDYINMDNIDQYEPILGKLNGHISGSVHLGQCNIGQNEEFLKRLSYIFGAPVHAGTGLMNPVLRFNTGDYVLCNPNSCHKVDDGP